MCAFCACYKLSCFPYLCVLHAHCVALCNVLPSIGRPPTGVFRKRSLEGKTLTIPHKITVINTNVNVSVPFVSYDPFLFSFTIFFTGLLVIILCPNFLLALLGNGLPK